MLMGIPKILTPELVKILMEMGHGDKIVIADGNFPCHSICQRVVRLDGHNVPEILEAMLKLFPLDTYSKPVALMSVVPGDKVETPIWDVYRSIIAPHTKDDVTFIERFAFYEEAKKAYAVIATSEKALYANIMLTKGVVVD